MARFDEKQKKRDFHVFSISNNDAKCFEFFNQKQTTNAKFDLDILFDLVFKHKDAIVSYHFGIFLC
jgi:hypothetical protein